MLFKRIYSFSVSDRFTMKYDHIYPLPIFHPPFPTVSPTVTMPSVIAVYIMYISIRAFTGVCETLSGHNP